MTKLKCPVCGSDLRVEHYFYKNLLYRSRLICSSNLIDGALCSYKREFPLPLVFWSQDLKPYLVA